MRNYFTRISIFAPTNPTYYGYIRITRVIVGTKVDGVGFSRVIGNYLGLKGKFLGRIGKLEREKHKKGYSCTDRNRVGLIGIA